MDHILIRGAKTHNLKNINVKLPRNKLIVITGLSGSGKSSLAFDTLYAEGQRRYVESLSAYARQFLSLMAKPDVEHIEGLSPAISIEQKATSHNPRSTVGTITEIYDYLRLLFARVGIPHCPEHKIPLLAQSVSQITDQILAWPEDTRVMILAPVIQSRKGEHQQLLDQLQRQGFIRARINGELVELDAAPKLDKNKKHDIDVVIDRIKVKAENTSRISDSVQTALNLSEGLVKAETMDEPIQSLLFSANFACPHCGHSLPELEPKLFSFNNPSGACATCDGLGIEQYFDPEKMITNPELTLPQGALKGGWNQRNFYYYSMLQSLAKHYKFDLNTPYQDLPENIQQILLYGSGKEKITFEYIHEKGQVVEKKHPFEGILINAERRYRETNSDSSREDLAQYISHTHCRACDGARLNITARNVLIEGGNLSELTQLSIQKASQKLDAMHLEGHRGEIAEKILTEIRQRLRFLINVGLDYLTLSRSAETLSGGEAQRIRLASQIGAGLVGVMYVLDEPSIGLHPRDNDRLLESLKNLRDLGNTVIVVEHDEETILAADYILDIGPGAGVHGGKIVAEGTPQDVLATPESLTAAYLTGKKSIGIPNRLAVDDQTKWLSLKGATGNNLKDVTLNIPLERFCCITGVSGSGKSTLINQTLLPILSLELNGAKLAKPAPYQSIEGLEHCTKVIAIDQSPIGRTPRSNPATYTGLFTEIRDLFAQTNEAKARGYAPGRFSFNVKGGRCETCDGDGLIKVEMHFLPDVYVTCDTCKGKRYNRETLEILYKGQNISNILQFTIEKAREFFDFSTNIARKLQTLIDVGLGYLELGQSATTLSGGEAQRVKLAKELSRRPAGNTLYLLDEPTTGLHFHDVHQLLGVLHYLRDRGNSLIVIEHNLDVVKTADWVIDLGPEGGNGGGQIMAQGTPEMLAEVPTSHTGRFLKPLLEKGQNVERLSIDRDLRWEV
jgi:excinuclease ABC subunit A